jgi:thioredoxin 1
MSNARDITVDEFQSLVLEADQPVLLEIWGDDCPICTTMHPIIDDIAGDLAGSVNILRIWGHAEMELAHRYGIRGVPTMLLFKDGEVIARTKGYHPKPELLAFIGEHVTIS